MLHPPQEQPQELLPFFLLRIPVMTIARSTAATTAAAITVGQFMKTLLSENYLAAPALTLGVFTVRTSSL